MHKHPAGSKRVSCPNANASSPAPAPGDPGVCTDFPEETVVRTDSIKYRLPSGVETRPSVLHVMMSSRV